MSYVLLIFCTLLLTGALLALVWLMASKQKGKLARNVERRRQELEAKTNYCDEIEASLAGCISAEVLQTRYVEMQVLDEALRAERGRITITEAEKETVDVRLRELEEIEREIDASGVETKEEIKILQKKAVELRKSLEGLRDSLIEGTKVLDQLMADGGSIASQEERLVEIRASMQATMEHGEKVLTEIETGNAQYFTMKSRYDALDIEYAQLYEKFSAETAQKQKANG